jgi:hypothetical protein
MSFLGKGVASVAPTNATPLVLTAAAAATSFPFLEPKGKVIVSVDPAYAGQLKIAWNGTASATVWDAPPIEGGGYAVSPDGLIIESVSIYAETADATYQTSFNVRGW